MNIEKLLACGDQLTELSATFAALPGSVDGVAAAAYFTIAANYVAELARHLSEGMEPFDAVEATARGSLELEDSPALTTLKVLLAKPKE